MSNQGIFSIDDTNEVCDTWQVRIASGNPSSHTWAKYRSLVGVPPKSKTTTLRKAILLFACADLGKNQGKRGITKQMVYAHANLLMRNHQGMAEAFRVFSGADGITGKELPQVIQQLTGRKISTRTLYHWGSKPDKPRNLPKYSKDAVYTAGQVRKWLEVAC